MSFRLFIVDDDRAIRRILTGIIEDHELGEVVGEAASGEDAEKKIMSLKPDIVLMDLLIPGKDGIEVIRSLREKGFPGYFIMISQVEAEDVVTQAYASGIEFFIHKPINVMEVVQVISKVEEIIRLRETLQLIRSTVEKASGTVKTAREKQIRARVDFLLADLGILGEAGSEDIRLIVEKYEDVKNKMSNLQDLYQYLKSYYEAQDKKKSTDVKAIEMRIRRAVNKAFQNICSMGLESYDSEQFNRYAWTLFDFKEVKKEMDFMRGKRPDGGKINIRKFIEGSVLMCSE